MFSRFTSGKLIVNISILITHQICNLYLQLSWVGVCVSTLNVYTGSVYQASTKFENSGGHLVLGGACPVPSTGENLATQI